MAYSFLFNLLSIIDYAFRSASLFKRICVVEVVIVRDYF
tara:strand:- start:316 stop:432 length:117 start_codon:yes stop_codon:yes gene_type:complete